ncbi:MAG TPA: DUF2865 domain-containing protein [Xanthobacteraceae bacterium]|jgi:hypothetical protein|nr:DUF2865 domain-containing protein [Xanthobacteraceae bacterium]
MFAQRQQSRLQAAALAGALAFGVFAPATANAGFFDFLFNDHRDEQPSPPAQSYADPSARIAPAAPLGQESVRGAGGNTGHGVAFCVRLCDGQHFPLEQMNNATPVETCRAMCPAARTKVYYGSEIGGSVAKDGARYTDLDVAFVYRKQMVANCTCNGKDALGLATFDMATDPTLRPGDIVSTKEGLKTFTGRNGAVAQFTPVNTASINTQLNSVTSVAGMQAQARAQAQAAQQAQSQLALTRRVAPPQDDASDDEDPGTISMPQQAAPPVNVGANGRGTQPR